MNLRQHLFSTISAFMCFLTLSGLLLLSSAETQSARKKTVKHSKSLAKLPYEDYSESVTDENSDIMIITSLPVDPDQHLAVEFNKRQYWSDELPQGFELSRLHNGEYKGHVVLTIKAEQVSEGDRARVLLQCVTDSENKFKALSPEVTINKSGNDFPDGHVWGKSSEQLNSDRFIAGLTESYGFFVEAGLDCGFDYGIIISTDSALRSLTEKLEAAQFMSHKKVLILLDDSVGPFKLKAPLELTSEADITFAGISYLREGKNSNIFIYETNKADETDEADGRDKKRLQAKTTGINYWGHGNFKVSGITFIAKTAGISIATPLVRSLRPMATSYTYLLQLQDKMPFHVRGECGHQMVSHGFSMEDRHHLYNADRRKTVMKGTSAIKKIGCSMVNLVHQIKDRHAGIRKRLKG